MSDPFLNIDQEVTLDKIKSLFNKYKKIIFIISITLIIIISAIFYISHNKKAKDIRLSGYLIEIISIINHDEEKAVKELEKLTNLEHPGHEVLSNLLLSKIYLKRQDFAGAVNHLSKIQLKGKELATLGKLKHYFLSVAYLGKNDKKKFQENINLLLSYGDYWSLLAHELRGHFLFAENNLEGASKDFLKILNEQLATPSLRQRSQEMLNNIKLNDKSNN